MRRYSSSVYESSLERATNEKTSIILQKSEKFKKKQIESFYENIQHFSQQTGNKQKGLSKQRTLYDSQTKFNGPINIFSQFQFEMTQVSQAGSFKHQSEVPSFYETELSSKIQDLQTQLEKKSGLVKYLERKCGHHILKTTKKYQDRIVELQTEIKVLKKTVEYLSKSESKSRVLSCFQQTNEFSCPQNQSSKYSKKNFNSKDLFKLTDTELIEIILTQAQQIQNLYKKSQIFQSRTNSVRKLSKQKKVSFSASKKPPTLFSHIDMSLRKSNQNLNQLNLGAVLKDTQNLNLSIRSQDSNKKQPIIPSFRPSIQHTQAQIQTDEIPIPIISVEQINLQTEQSMKDIQNFQINLIDAGIQNEILNKQIQKLKEQNNKLKQQIQLYNQRLQNYCQELNDKIFDPNAISQVQIFQASADSTTSIQEPSINIQTSTPIPNNPQLTQSQQYLSQKPSYIQQNYYQILHIFGIQIRQPMYMQQQHQILRHQICGMKKQISKLLKQFKKLQKQLNQSFNNNHWLQNVLKNQQDRSNKLQEYIKQILLIIQNSNDQIMCIKNRQLNNKYMRMMMYQKQQQGEEQDINNLEEQQGQGQEYAIKLSKTKLQNRPTYQQSVQEEEVNSPIMISLDPSNQQDNQDGYLEDIKDKYELQTQTQVNQQVQKQVQINKVQENKYKQKANLDKYLQELELIELEVVEEVQETQGASF